MSKGWLRGCGLCALLLSLLTSSTALAQTRSPAEQEAAERFDRALRLVNVGDLSGGLAEFQRAYALVPSPVVLWNLGLVYVALNRPVDAVAAFEKVLEEPQRLDVAEVDRARRLLGEQLQRIGKLTLTTSVSEGSVEIDNVEVARLPVNGPLPVAAGVHTVGVVSAGFAPSRREVVIAGQRQLDVRLDLVAIDGRLAHLRVDSTLPDADVLIDGQRVGKTPLEQTVTVAPGSHRVDVARLGYTSASRSIVLQDGAEARLNLVPSVDAAELGRHGGYLLIESSEALATVAVDGLSRGPINGSLRLPFGRHRIHVERGGFLPAERDVDVGLANSTRVKVALEPTPDTRANFVEGALSRRTWSLLGIGAGAVIGAGGVTLALVEGHKLDDASRALSTLERGAEPGAGGECDPTFPHGNAPGAHEDACTAALVNAASDVDSLRLNRTLGWVTGGVGGAILITSAVLLLTGPDPHKYDRPTATKTLAGARVSPIRLHDGWFISGTFTF